ncbi:MAG: helix-hairpin-helix domain-containing protein [Nitrospira sp.]
MLLHVGRRPTRSELWTLVPAALFGLLMVGLLTMVQPVSSNAPVWAATRQNSPGAASPVDINTASIGDLSTRLKITEADARQIIRGRPYRSKDELRRKKVISQTTYEKIKNHILPSR